MAEQMRCGNSKLVYRFKMHKGGEDGEEAGGEQKQAGDSPVLPGMALFGLACPWYPRAHAHPHAAPLSLACKPAALNLLRVPGLSAAERAIRRAAACTWSALCGSCLLGVR